MDNETTSNGAVWSIPTVLGAARGLVLSSYAGNDDVLFGLTLDSSGRDRETPLPFRLQIKPQQTVKNSLESAELRINRLAAEWHREFTDGLQSLLGQAARQFHKTTLWVTRD